MAASSLIPVLGAPAPLISQSDLSTPMKEDMEQDYSIKLALYKPVLEKLAQLLGGNVVEQFCGHDKRRRLLVCITTIPPSIICGERAKAGHKVPDALKPSPSYMAFIHKMSSVSVIPEGLFEIAANKQNVEPCLKILVEFMTPIMKHLKTLLERPEAKQLGWDVMVVGEKDTPRAALGFCYLKEWAEWSKAYWTPLEKDLLEKLNAVPQGTDAVPFVRKTEEEIEKSREEGRKQGEINNAHERKISKRKAPLLTNVNLNSKLQHPLNGSTIQNGHLGREYASPPHHPGSYSSPYYRYPYEHYPLPPAQYPERPYSNNPYVHPESRTSPNASTRKSLLPTPGMPPPPPQPGYPGGCHQLSSVSPEKQMEGQKKAEQIHHAIQYMVSLFEERYTKPDGTQFAVMESPIVKRAINLEYKSMAEAETILSALKTTWDEVTGTNTKKPSLSPREEADHRSPPQLATNVETISFNGQTYHRRRAKDELIDGQKALWSPSPAEAFRVVTIVHVKRQKAVIDSNNPEEDLQIIELNDLFLPGC